MKFLTRDYCQMTELQSKAYNDITIALKQKKSFIAFYGSSKAGKSLILNHVFTNLNTKRTNTIYGECNDNIENNNFGVLQEFFSNNIPKIDISLGISLSHFIGFNIGISKRHFNEYQQIKQYISRLVKKGITNVIIENINNCDSMTLMLLSDLKNKFKNHEEFRLIVTIDSDKFLRNDVVNFLQDAYNIYLQNPNLQEFKKIFSSFLRKKDIDSLNDEIFRLIFKNYKGNLNYLKQIAQAYDDDLIVFNNNEIIDEKGLIRSIVMNHIKSFDDASDIILSLQYGGLMGISFPISCIEYLVKDKAIKTLRKAEHIDLIECEESSARFLSDYIRNIFNITNSEERKKYCADITECIKNIFPARYNLRIAFAEQSDNTEYVSLLYTLLIIQRLKKYNFFDVNCYRKISDRHLYFIDNYRNAWNYLFNGNYEESIKILLRFDGQIERELQAEKDILLGSCAIKNIDQSYRKIALNYLRGYKNEKDVNNEKDVWQRLYLRKINLLIHCGQYDEANTLISEFRNLIPYDCKKDDETTFVLNILKRKATAFLSYDIALKQIKESVEYFCGENKKFPLHLKQYYIAMNNYAAVLGEQSKWTEAYSIIKEINQLISENPMFVFPRKNLYEHNKIIIDYFSGNCAIGDTIKKLENYLNSYQYGADIIFVKSNLAVFYAMELNYTKAKNCLKEVMCLYSEDFEGIYDFCVDYNLAIVNFLLKKETNLILKDLSEITIPHVMDCSYIKKKVDCAKALIAQGVQCNGFEWMNAILRVTPSFQSDSWNFYGLGYDINLLYDWDDD